MLARALRGSRRIRAPTRSYSLMGRGDVNITSKSGLHDNGAERDDILAVAERMVRLGCPGGEHLRELAAGEAV